MSDAPDPQKRRVTRLFLLCHAATAATRRAAFPADEPIEEKSRTLAAALVSRLPSVGRVLTSPAQAARQTASVLAATVEEAIALHDCDYGRWAGRTLDEASTAEPEAFFAWLSDPAVAPHGGEALSGLIERVGAWLGSDALQGGVLAVTHAAVVRAAVVHVLGAPPQSFWRIDVPPLSLVEIRRGEGPWTLRAMRPAAGTEDALD